MVANSSLSRIIKYAFKMQVIDFVNTHSLRDACIEFGLGNSTVRAILKSGNFVCHICPRKCSYKRQLERHLMSVHKIKEEEKETEEVEKYDDFIYENPPVVDIKELGDITQDVKKDLFINDEE